MGGNRVKHFKEHTEYLYCMVLNRTVAWFKLEFCLLGPLLLRISANEIKFMPYEHPDIKKKRFDFDASEEHNLYVESYTNHDLMIIADLDSNLICNTYEPE